MSNPVYSDMQCSACGRVMGEKPGVQVILGLICDDPLCHYQREAPIHAQRDAYIVSAALSGVSVSQVAFANGMSRQRAYQIVDAWKAGV